MIVVACAPSLGKAPASMPILLLRRDMDWSRRLPKGRSSRALRFLQWRADRRPLAYRRRYGGPRFNLLSQMGDVLRLLMFGEPPDDRRVPGILLSPEPIFL
jgi:hypothetical protein